MLGGLGFLLLIGVCFLRHFFSDYQFSNKNCFNKASSQLQIGKSFLDEYQEAITPRILSLDRKQYAASKFVCVSFYLIMHIS